ncbi:uncharacterized protein BKCO1_6300010 [Diplodia corticola]|uniref:Uncharacterized protein n=1 Tax=Diplodia corticola TaxID=236234 RepID=A0A1J9RRY1_9PEZI|nr:uncharacterized protein BKCO1_6300010 [Diplodia corticola]OJD30285.1 hypothetical protein BKCO1_6300010 [Diplodia corticola]
MAWLLRWDSLHCTCNLRRQYGRHPPPQPNADDYEHPEAQRLHDQPHDDCEGRHLPDSAAEALPGVDVGGNAEDDGVGEGSPTVGALACAFTNWLIVQLWEVFLELFFEGRGSYAGSGVEGQPQKLEKKIGEQKEASRKSQEATNKKKKDVEVKDDADDQKKERNGMSNEEEHEQDGGRVWEGRSETSAEKDFGKPTYVNDAANGLIGGGWRGETYNPVHGNQVAAKVENDQENLIPSEGSAEGMFASSEGSIGVANRPGTLWATFGANSLSNF